MEKKKRKLSITSIIFLCINIIGLVCFTCLILYLRSFYYKDAASISVLENLLRKRTDANIIRFYLSSHYIYIITALILIAKEFLKSKKVTLIVNIIIFLVVILAIPVVFAWFVHLAPILVL